MLGRSSNAISRRTGGEVNLGNSIPTVVAAHIATALVCYVLTCGRWCCTLSVHTIGVKKLFLRSTPGGYLPDDASETFDMKAPFNPFSAWSASTIECTKSGIDSSLICFWSQFVASKGCRSCPWSIRFIRTKYAVP